MSAAKPARRRRTTATPSASCRRRRSPITSFCSRVPRYDPERDFAPITNPFFTTQVLVVNAALGVHSLAELAALSKAKPKTLSYTAPSIPADRVHGQWIKSSGADIVQSAVPRRRRSGQQRARRLDAGGVFRCFQLAVVHPQRHRYCARGRQPAPLAAFARRADARPNSAIGGDLTRLYFGIVAPAGTPQPIIHKLRDEFAAIGADPQFRQKHMIDLGLEPVFDTPEEFASFLKQDRAASARIVREAGMKRSSFPNDHRVAHPRLSARGSRRRCARLGRQKRSDLGRALPDDARKRARRASPLRHRRRPCSAMPRITCAARPKPRSSKRSSAGPIMPPRFRPRTRACFTASPPCCHAAAGLHQGDRARHPRAWPQRHSHPFEPQGPLSR